MLNYNFYIKASGPDDFTTGSDHLWSDGEWHKVYPLKGREAGIDYEDDWPRRRRILNDSIQFLDRVVNGSKVHDYEYLTKVSSEDVELLFKIERVTDDGAEDFWTGYFSWADGENNPSRGIFTVTPTVYDEYKSVKENGDRKINIANLRGYDDIKINLYSKPELAISEITTYDEHEDYKLYHNPPMWQAWDLFTDYPVAVIDEKNQEYEGVNYWDNYTGKYRDEYGDLIDDYHIFIFRKETFRVYPGEGWEDETYRSKLNWGGIPGVWSKPIAEKQTIERIVGNGRATTLRNVIGYILRDVMSPSTKLPKYRSTFFDNDPVPTSKLTVPLPYDDGKTFSDLVNENYVTGETNLLSGLYFFPKSEVPEQSDPATKCMISFNELMDELHNIFNVYWYIDEDGYLRIEHDSWFEDNEVGIDLTTLEGGKYINKIDKTSYNETDRVSREHFSFPEAGGVDFIGRDIVYDKTRQEDNQNDIRSNVSTDMEYLLHNEDEADSEGFAMVLTDAGFIVEEKGELSGVTIANGHLSWANLHKRYWMHGRPYKSGSINGFDVDFKSVKYNITQDEIVFPALEIDPLKIIKTNVGNGRPQNMSYRLVDGTFHITIGYNDVAIEPVVLPVVITDDVSDVVTTTATCGGSIVSGGPILAKGCCWRPGTFGVPTIENSKTEDGSGTDDFVSYLTGLNPGTTYRVRAYAVNAHGVGYGLSRVFTAGSISAPVVVTGTISEIQPTSAKCGGTVTYEGSSSVTERGACWSSTGVPDITGYHQSSGTGPGAFTVDLTGLSAGVVYDIRTYAINEYGVSYGKIASFITASLSPPTVATDNPTNVRQNSATFSGLAITEVGSSISERGFIYCL
ncbi:MAG: hypothetical protein WC319_08275, partial [Candidatus Paceibacterota bacterium]